MKLLSSAVPGALVALLASMLLGGCSASHRVPRAYQTAPQMSAASVSGVDNVPIQKIPFRIGVSSATVERMARQQACTGGQGAGLITEPGPAEVYRMQCDNGKTFMARCELRQCKQMQ
jgi:hypothetical protein